MAAPAGLGLGLVGLLGRWRDAAAPGSLASASLWAGEWVANWVVLGALVGPGWGLGVALLALGGSLGVCRRGWCMPWVGDWVLVLYSWQCSRLMLVFLRDFIVLKFVVIFIWCHSTCGCYDFNVTFLSVLVKICSTDDLTYKMKFLFACGYNAIV